MEYKNNLKIKSLSHDDLVNFLSTALYGSSYLSAEYDKEFYNSIPEDQRHGDCYEDKMADVLLNGGTIYIFDNYSEGEGYGSPDDYEVITENGYEYTMYKLTLDKLIRGLEKCANGTYNVHDDSKYIKECFDEVADEEEGDYDLSMADSLMQVILFNELVYG